MALWLDVYSLIIPIEKIDECYPGGFEAYITKIGGPDIGCWYDEHLLRLGAMNPLDIDTYIEFWKNLGLTPTEERDGKKCWKDMCVVNHMGFPSIPCDWLVSAGPRIVYLKGKPPGEVIGRLNEKKP
jgi:hypothetical protein